MAGSGKGSSGAGSGSYSGAGRGSYGPIAGSYAVKSNRLYGRRGLYDSIGTGYVKGAGINRLEGLISKTEDFHIKMNYIRDSYLKGTDAKRNLEDMYSLKQMFTSAMLSYYRQEMDKRKEGLDKRLCPHCGRDSIICVCNN
jgi:hypothetical protein